MPDFQEQLQLLRRRIARIDRKYADGLPPAKPVDDPRRPARYFVDEWLSGEEVETPFGRHFETEKLYDRHRRHGSMDIGALAELACDSLAAISANEVPGVPPNEWAFLDTETTGLAGGTGTYAFLVGVGRITPEGFRVRQFFMRDYGEEGSLLASLSAHLQSFRVLITYNGRVYDQPLLETRYRMSRQRTPFSLLAHLDLLFGARRLWKLRYQSCRLVDLEQQVLGVEREGDLPGELIPYVYFEYLRTREAFRLVPLFHHNATDILTLACLAGIVPAAFEDPAGSRTRNGAELVGLGRWLLQAGEKEQALALFLRAIENGLADDLLFRTMWDAAQLERQLGRLDAAFSIWRDLAAAKNPYQTRAFEELAKRYEHSDRNYELALEMTRSALDYEDREDLRHREKRLARKIKTGKASQWLDNWSSTEPLSAPSRSSLATPPQPRKSRGPGKYSRPRKSPGSPGTHV
jgi:uncharacterized protein YprB with RNaseH-like and TPR domain